MKTLNLKAAAQFLNMNTESLRSKTKAGYIPGAKVGKRWLFIEDDLANYIRSQYAPKRQAARVTGDEEVAKCHSTAEAKTASGGCASRHPVDAEYANLLGL